MGGRSGHEHMVHSTKQIAEVLESGAQVMTFRGPFYSREEASQRMGIYWEAIMDDDDD